MFQSDELKKHLEESSTVRSQSAIVAEWNMNIAENIKAIGNYRYRPQETNSIYRTLMNSFDENDQGKFYTGATDADITVDGGYDDNNEPILFQSNKQKVTTLYSLEDCFKKFRPRSGINKASYFTKTFLHHSNMEMFNRPRYYMADKNDGFKYWSSFRTESGVERGIATKQTNGQYYIDDAAPFVVYENKVPTNRIVVKMQTNVGNVDLGPFSSPAGSFADPLYGDSNKTTPVKWKIQTLQNNTWIDAMSFNPASVRRDGTSIIKSDGYVELAYGLIVPERYREIFIKAEEYSSTVMLPEESVVGYAYLIKTSDSELGTYYIWNDGKYETFTPTYGWYLQEETVDRLTNFVTDLTSPATFLDPVNNVTSYREFEFISGIRVVAETMNCINSRFDLIEISPRLSVDLSSKITSFNISKIASDLGNTGLPVGQLLASIGTLEVFDYDQAFNETNMDSIISGYLAKNIQVKLYEIIVDVNGYDYYVPLKTMYIDGFPKLNVQDRRVSLSLRDMFFYFETLTAPEILVRDVSLSYAISLLLDSVGYSNYTFKRIDKTKEPIIPFFFIGPDKTVAQVLNDLAVSTQTAMFFDEYNNLVMMSKDYILPDSGARQVDFVLRGTNDFIENGAIKNSTTNRKLSNIIQIASKDNSVYNDGKITYQTRYIQKTYGTIRQASLIDNANEAKSWIYKPVLLWEISGEQSVRPINDDSGNQSAYTLAAIPLNSTLSAAVPTVSGNKIINNVIDMGEGVYWLSRYNGYFYSNGEVIKYDAVQYAISGAGNVWITSTQDYQSYFAKLPFNGKMYPTGIVRIYAEPDYEVVAGTTQLKNGAVAKHGRGQFGTSVVSHNSGLDPYWSDNTYVRGCMMQSDKIFALNNSYASPEAMVSALGLTNAAAGQNNTLAQKTTRNGVIKNFLSTSFLTETGINDLKSTQSGTVQSSALVMNGPSFSVTERPSDFISYQYKELPDSFKHFGTRMRIIGKIDTSETRGQTPIGVNTYYVVTGSDPSQQVNISGGSGGLAVMVNPSTNVGYYFELIALTATNVSSYANGTADNLDNLIFYKVMADGSGNAIPVKLWGGLGNIIVDDGKFTGQYRMANEDTPTVFDMAVEYEDIGTIRRFYLYINNKIIATVDDASPLPKYNYIAPFVRGSTRCMFENIYALGNNYSQNTVYSLNTPIASAFGDSEVDANESFRKYAMSGVIQATYLTGISTGQSPKYNIYFEEFGTIMREASFLKIRYDKAYPALYAQLSPTFNKIKGYTVSGFKAGSYGAEFLLFNSTDTTINLDETSGNYVRIQGITFTQQSNNELTVDNFFDKNSDFSNPSFNSSGQLAVSPLKENQKYEDIKVSRMTYGKHDFSITAPYIQTADEAKGLMSWLVSKVTKPRKSIGLEIFANPMLQLGDIVTIDYVNADGVGIVSSPQTEYVIYNIDYSKNSSGPSMTVHLSEVSNG
jgi:hypothetical protein